MDLLSGRLRRRFGHRQCRAWANRYVPLGTFNLYVNSVAIYLVLGFGAIHYLDRAASRAWATFRPAVSLGDEEADRFAYQLVTMPARPTLGWTILGIAIGVTYFASQVRKTPRPR